ncbi:MAG: hypothetical protein NDJ89_02950 [Oligoflexia bacterium]|nr:hypothetical protein [Oligoflexia bacterium]
MSRPISSLEAYWGPFDRPVSVFLLESRGRLAELGLLRPLPDWVSSFTHWPHFFFQVYDGSSPEFRGLQHEFCHLFIWQKLSRKLPAWIEEGICEALSAMPDPRPIRAELMEKPFAEWDTPTLLDLDPGPLPENQAYRKCHSFVRYLIQKEGWERFRASLDDSNENVVKRLCALEPQWKDAISAAAIPEASETGVP